MENAENVNSSSSQLPAGMRRWILLTEDHLFQVSENGNKWTEAELQAAKKCLRLRKQYNFTEVGLLLEKIKLKENSPGFTPNDQAKGIIPTGLTVKEKAEREWIYEEMDKLRNGKSKDSQDGKDA